MTSRQLAETIGISQPTVSRLISALGDEVLRFGEYRSIHYALRRTSVVEPEIPVYRITPEGRIAPLGSLAPVHSTGFVMIEPEGRTLHSEGLPWWMHDMRPQGFLGRAYVARYAESLGLPVKLGDWQDAHVLRALLAHGHDAVGNLLLGDAAREHFLTQQAPQAISEAGLAEEYSRLALLAAQGDDPGSSAGGEQPKFSSHAMTASGACHVIVKFTLPAQPNVANPIAQRWRDLLLSEHLALGILRNHGIAAANTRIVDHGEQRFLQVERFDRVGLHGRRGLVSLAALDAEFVGQGNGGWPGLTAALAKAGHIRQEAQQTSCLLHAFGTLIGNSDMHAGNLSFMTDCGRPYELAPAYDMLPMAFAPRSSGELPVSLGAARIDSRVNTSHWIKARTMAADFVTALCEHTGFSAAFKPCIDALEAHLQQASGQIERL